MLYTLPILRFEHTYDKQQRSSGKEMERAQKVVRKERGKKMKQPKKPTLAQKKIIKAAGLEWKTWNVADEDNISMTLISKKSGQRRVIFK